MAARKKSPPLLKSPPLVEGRFPPSLPADPDALLDGLRGAEALALDAKTMFEASQRRLALVRQPWPEGAARRLIDRIGFDVGEYPENLDYSKAKTRPQMKKLDEAFQALLAAGIAREETLTTLFAIAAVDVTFQAEWLEKLDTMPTRLAGRLFAALAGSPTLNPVLVERLRRDVRTRDLKLVATAAWAFSRQGPEVAYAELAPLVSSFDLKRLPDLECAKAILDAGAATPWSPAWQPILEKLVPLKDSPYDYNRINDWRAETQLGTAAAKALGAKK